MLPCFEVPKGAKAWSLAESGHPWDAYILCTGSKSERSDSVTVSEAFLEPLDSANWKLISDAGPNCTPRSITLSAESLPTCN